MEQKINPNHHFIESVCSKCPGTYWGKSSKCRIHDMHIGQISSCQQWEDAEASQWLNDGGQLAFTSLEPALELLHVAQEALDGYAWMVNRIEVYREADGRYREDAAAGIVQYGEESVLPKAQGITSDPTFQAAKKNLRLWERIKRYERTIKMVDEFADSNILSEKEQIVLEGIMDGEKMINVAKEAGISRSRAQELKNEVVKKFAWWIHDNKNGGEKVSC